MFILNFMGPTHALSGLALYLLILALNPALITNSVLHSTAVSVITAGGLVTAGQALGPDIDNPSSTIVNLLWPVGHLLSIVSLKQKQNHLMLTHIDNLLIQYLMPFYWVLLHSLRHLFQEQL